MPRHVGLIGFNQPPRAKEWFTGLEKFAGQDVFVQVIPDDTEAQNLANEIRIVLHSFGLNASQKDDTRSHFSLTLAEGIRVLYPVGKPFTAQEPHQPWFVWHDAAEALARSLTKAGLGVLKLPVSVSGFTNMPTNPPLIPYFDPPLTGVFVAVGARPVGMTVQMLRSQEAQKTP